MFELSQNKIKFELKKKRAQKAQHAQEQGSEA